jgi:hypothetical protein
MFLAIWAVGFLSDDAKTYPSIILGVKMQVAPASER